MAKISHRPTHGEPLNEIERAMARGVEAGVKSWQGGPRQVRNRRGGLYVTRTGNTHGGKKGRSKNGPKPGRDVPRVVKRPPWAAKYQEA